MVFCGFPPSDVCVSPPFLHLARAPASAVSMWGAVACDFCSLFLVESVAKVQRGVEFRVYYSRVDKGAHPTGWLRPLVHAGIIYLCAHVCP